MERSRTGVSWSSDSRDEAARLAERAFFAWIGVAACPRVDIQARTRPTDSCSGRDDCNRLTRASAKRGMSGCDLRRSRRRRDAARKDIPRVSASTLRTPSIALKNSSKRRCLAACTSLAGVDRPLGRNLRAGNGSQWSIARTSNTLAIARGRSLRCSPICCGRETGCQQSGIARQCSGTWTRMATHAGYPKAGRGASRGAYDRISMVCKQRPSR